MLKSVYVSLCLEWLVDSTGAAPVIVTRHPFNVLAGWKDRGWLDSTPERDLLSEIDEQTVARLSHAAGTSPPPHAASPMVRATHLFGLLSHGLHSALSRHPDWLVATHEELCAAPRERMSSIARSLGLPLSAKNDDAISAFDRPGGPYSVHRRIEELPRAWRDRLTDAEADEIESVLEAMGLGALAADPPM